MLIDTTLLVNNPWIVKGLLDGSLIRHGGVIRWAAGTAQGGQIVKHLSEVLPLSPISGATQIIGQGLTYYKLLGIEKQLGAMMGLTQIAAGASVLNLGVSILGFAYMGYKLHQIQKAIANLQEIVIHGFDHVNRRLDQMSGQLTYLALLTETSLAQQEKLAEAIANLHRTSLMKEVADLSAELLDRSRFPNDSPRQALKTASRVRLFLASQAVQATPELDAELMLNTDVSIQGWAVATATEVNLLLEMGENTEAKQLMMDEFPKFRQVAQLWGNALIDDDNQYLATGYRFTASPFQDYISLERVNRILEISGRDQNLSEDQIEWRKKDVAVEFEMSYSHRYDQSWVDRQLAVAEYLDSLSELSARLEGLESFAALCEQENVKSSRDILPQGAVPGLYICGEKDYN